MSERILTINEAIELLKKDDSIKSFVVNMPLTGKMTVSREILEDVEPLALYIHKHMEDSLRKAIVR